jgi:hypothetical protein
MQKCLKLPTESALSTDVLSSYAYRTIGATSRAVIVIGLKKILIWTRIVAVPASPIKPTLATSTIRSSINASRTRAIAGIASASSFIGEFFELALLNTSSGCETICSQIRSVYARNSTR